MVREAVDWKVVMEGGWSVEVNRGRRKLRKGQAT